MAGTSRRGEVLLLVLSVGIVLLFAEVALRVVGAGAPQPTGYAPVNTNRRAARPRNTHGYRDHERAIPKPAGHRRVLVLGDSFAWGHGVEFEDAFPQRLERGLNRRRSPERWEVVSLSLPGQNTVDEEAVLAKEGWDYQPDVVLLAFVLNDSEDPQAAEARRVKDWSQPRAPGLLEASALYRFVSTRLWATAENRRRITGYRSMYTEDATGWIAAQKSLHRMGAACRERGVPFVVAIFPLFGNPMGDGYPFTEVHATIARAAEAAGAMAIDLLPAYRGLRNDLLIVDGADDEHPNEIAHRVAANLLTTALDEVVPRASPAP